MRQRVLHAAVEQVEHAAADQQRQQKRGADDGDRQQRLEGRLGDELNDNDLPVGGGDQGAALEGGLDGGVVHAGRGSV